MKTLASVFITTVFTLLLTAAVIFGLGDSDTLVPPPDSVVEGFVRQVISGRYDRAIPYLSREAAAQMNTGPLKQLKERLDSRAGKVLNVQGEPGIRKDERAEAIAKLQTRNGEIALRFDLIREEGVWSIQRWESIS